MAQNEILPDLLADCLDVVFIGSAVGARSARRGHYYSHPTNAFWRLLDEVGFTPYRLRPEQDAEVLRYGIGVSDLVKDVAQSNDDGLNFSTGGEVLARVVGCSPGWIAFNGIGVGRQAAKQCGASTTVHGHQRWTIAGIQVFVLPSSSSANSRPVIEGKTKVEWWSELRQLVSAQERRPEARSRSSVRCVTQPQQMPFVARSATA